MERSLRDLLEWIVLGLLVVVGVLLALWVGGWVFTFLGRILLALSGLIWTLLTYILPVLVIAAIGYGVVYFWQRRRTSP